MSSREASRGDVLRPFLTFMEGKPVAYLEMVTAGRKLARALASRGRSVILCGDSEWAGVWNLEQLTDCEAVDWGLWVAKRLLRF